MGVWGKVAMLCSYSSAAVMGAAPEVETASVRVVTSGVCAQLERTVVPWPTSLEAATPSDVTSSERWPSIEGSCGGRVRGLSEEQVRLHPTISALSIGGLIKHVTLVERNWTDFITEGTSAIGGGAATSSPSTPPPST